MHIMINDYFKLISLKSPTHIKGVCFGLDENPTYVTTGLSLKRNSNVYTQFFSTPSYTSQFQSNSISDICKNGIVPS